ncbi:MAG: GTP 3',8-cyclase MoaA [Bacillota bacterium]
MNKLIDKYNRNVNYLRISVTDRCNLRCKYCMPDGNIDLIKDKEILDFDEIIKIVKTAAKLGVNKVRLTGGEPLVRKNIDKLIKKIKSIKNIDEIGLTTNGILLKELAKDLKLAGLDRVNISLDTLDSNKFKEITGFDKFNNVISGINEAKKVGLTPIKINTVIMKGVNDLEIDKFINMAIKHKLIIRFIEFMPSGDKVKLQNSHYVSNMELFEKINKKYILNSKNTFEKSPSKTYKIKGKKAKVGFISPISNHFCSKCNRLRLTSSGRLRPCLSSDKEIDLKPYINNNETLEKLFLKAIKIKPKNHSLMENNDFFVGMSQIGG